MREHKIPMVVIGLVIIGVAIALITVPGEKIQIDEITESQFIR